MENRVDIKSEAWTNFTASIDWESDDRNFKYDFQTMTRKYGQAFIEYCKAAWIAAGGFMDEDEFCRMNADMPRKFFENKIK